MLLANTKRFGKKMVWENNDLKKKPDTVMSDAGGNVLHTTVSPGTAPTLIVTAH